MAGRVLLDTSIVVELFADDQAVSEGVANADEVYVPSIVIGELVFGAMKSTKIEANLRQVEALVADKVVLGCDVGTARIYGEIKNELRAKGRPLPENDIWIAATAIQYRLLLITRDAHFEQIDRLFHARW